MAEEYDYACKLVLLGDSRVGKSRLFSRFTRRKLNPSIVPTIGVDCGTRCFQFEDKIIKTELWDTSYVRPLYQDTPFYYRDLTGAFLCYDITDQNSFEHVSIWKEKMEEHIDQDVVIMLIGNKSDFRRRRAVPTEEAVRFAKKCGMLFMETSALYGNNVKEAFTEMLAKIHKSRKLFRPITLGIINDHLFKLLLFGDKSTGKSSILSCFTRNEFGGVTQKSTEFYYEICCVRIKNEAIKVQIWDIPFENYCYEKVTKAFYHGAAGVLILYDITKRITLGRVFRCIEELQNYAEKDVVVMLVGNKSDQHDAREVPTEKARALAGENDMYFIETSASDGTNVGEAFINILTEMYTRYKSSQHDQISESESICSWEVIEEPKKKKKCSIM